MSSLLNFIAINTGDDSIFTDTKYNIDNLTIDILMKDMIDIQKIKNKSHVICFILYVVSIIKILKVVLKITFNDTDIINNKISEDIIKTKKTNFINIYSSINKDLTTYIDSINGLKITKIMDDYVLSGGSLLSNNKKYYEKYLKYKTKYMNKKSKIDKKY